MANPLTVPFTCHLSGRLLGRSPERPAPPGSSAARTGPSEWPCSTRAWWIGLRRDGLERVPPSNALRPRTEGALTSETRSRDRRCSCGSQRSCPEGGRAIPWTHSICNWSHTHTHTQKKNDLNMLIKQWVLVWQSSS